MTTMTLARQLVEACETAADGDRTFIDPLIKQSDDARAYGDGIRDITHGCLLAMKFPDGSAVILENKPVTDIKFTDDKNEAFIVKAGKVHHTAKRMAVQRGWHLIWQASHGRYIDGPYWED